MKLSIALVLTFLLFACNEQKANSHITHIQATKVSSDLFMGLPVVIKVQDSVLWISDFSTNYLVSGVHKNTGKILHQIAQKGNGPSEMTPPVHIFLDKGRLHLYDRNKHMLYNASINSKLLHEVTTFGNGYSLVYNLTDSTYIGTGLFKKRFSITDSAGNELHQTIEFPQYWNGEQKLSDRIKSIYHQTTRLCKHPSSPVIATCTSDILTAYNVKNNTINEKFQILMHNYAFNYNEGNFVSTNKQPNIPDGILDISCDDYYIYVLYDPNSQSDTNKENNEIRLYDWHGTLAKTFIPNINLSIITLDTTDNSIYGISTNDVPEIWNIKL